MNPLPYHRLIHIPIVALAVVLLSGGPYQPIPTKASAPMDLPFLQNPLDPELVKQLAELETMRLILIILFFAVVAVAMVAVAVVMVVRHLGKQVEISSRNSDKLAVNTSSLDRQTNLLDQLVQANTRKLALMEQNALVTNSVQTGVTDIQKTIHDSGIRNLKELVGDQATGKKSIGVLLVEGLEKVSSTLDTLHRDAGTRDTRMVEGLGAVERQMAQMNTLIALALKPPVSTPAPPTVETPVIEVAAAAVLPPEPPAPPSESPAA